MPLPAGKSSAVIVPHQATGPQRLAAATAFGLILGLAATLRFRWRDESGLFGKGASAPVIFALWHNRLALSLIVYRRYVQARQPGRRLAAMVSASRDGGLLARVLEHFGVEPVRGSSSRRGPQALLELTTWSERGYDLAITPDGPRGPRYVVQDGVMALAQLSGRPVVPVSFHLTWKYRVKSWDAFQVPLPWTRVEVRLGPPVRVPADAADATREMLRRQLEAGLRALTED